MDRLRPERRRGRGLRPAAEPDAGMLSEVRGISGRGSADAGQPTQRNRTELTYIRWRDAIWACGLAPQEKTPCLNPPLLHVTLLASPHRTFASPSFRRSRQLRAATFNDRLLGQRPRLRCLCWRLAMEVRPVQCSDLIPPNLHTNLECIHLGLQLTFGRCLVAHSRQRLHMWERGDRYASALKRFNQMDDVLHPARIGPTDPGSVASV